MSYFQDGVIKTSISYLNTRMHSPQQTHTAETGQSADGPELQKPPTQNMLDYGLIMAAYTLGGSVKISLHSIITALVDAYVREYNLLPEEFFQRFRINGISQVIVDAFLDTLTEGASGIDEIVKRVRSKIENLGQKKLPTSPPAFIALMIPLMTLDHSLGSLGRILERPASKVAPKQTRKLKSEDFSTARSEVKQFVDNFASQHYQGTLSTLIDGLRRRYPAINFYEIFDGEIKKNLARQIDIATENIVRDEFNKLFEKDKSAYEDEDKFEEGNGDDPEEIKAQKQKKQKRQNFVLSYIFGRCVKIKSGHATRVNSGKLEQFIEFLDKHNYPIECLYVLIYNKLKKLRAAEKIIEIEREATGKLVSNVGIPVQTAEKSTESHDVPYQKLIDGYDEFFSKHFIPLIKNVRQRKLPKQHNLHIVDAVKISPEGMAMTVFPDNVMEPLHVIADKDQRRYMAWLRDRLGYGRKRRGGISDKQIKQAVAKQLRLAQKQFKYTTKNALKMRPADDPIRTDCQFVPAIFHCQDLQKLILWSSDPQSFLQQFPDYLYMPPKIIQHQARTMFEMFLYCRQRAFDPAYLQLRKDRREVENDFKDALQITKETPVTRSVRVAVPVDGNIPKSVQLKGKKRARTYKIFQGKHPLMHERPRETISAETEGITYMIYPVETKDFICPRAFFTLQLN